MQLSGYPKLLQSLTCTVGLIRPDLFAAAGALAVAQAKAQSDLKNPPKSLTGTIETPYLCEGQRSFHYVPLAAGLGIARKCLGQHEIAIQRMSGPPRVVTREQSSTLIVASGQCQPDEMRTEDVGELRNGPEGLLRLEPVHSIAGMVSQHDSRYPRSKA